MISRTKYIATIVLLLVVAGGTFFGGLKMGQKGYTYSGKQYKIVNQNEQPKNVDYSLLWQALTVLNDKYIDKPVDQQKILYGAVAGAIAAVGDPYTVFFDPQQYKDFKTELSGSFEGIGAEVGMKNGNIVIVAPLEDSPAKKAGLLTGDILLKIDDQDVAQYSLDQAVNKIRGQKGTQVKLTIFRESDNKQHDFTITRDTIVVKSVSYEVKDDHGKKVEVIHINRFGDDTVDLFAKAALDAQSNNVKGIIVDLRDDPGGYLDAAVAIASYWVKPGDLVVSEAHSDGTTQKYTAKGNNIFADIPTVVLANGGSASAAEILTGALHDHGFAKTVGVKTFGKGSVQQLVDLPQSTALKVTIAKWLTPNGININHNGLEPDYKVDLTAEQYQAGQDTQMDKALDLLK